MLNLEIRIGSPANFAAVVAVLAGAFIWTFFVARTRNESLLLAPFILVVAACAGFWAARGYGGLDESEHLHCAYLVSKGMLPYRDFWQHHPPLIWLCMAPLMRWFDSSPWIYEISRLIWTGVFVLIGLLGWVVARRVWRGQASAGVYWLVFLASAVLWLFPVVRPDLPSVLLMLGGIYFCLHAARGRNWACLCCGAAISLALTFTYKHFILALVPPIVILARPPGRRLYRVALYVAGLVGGVLPLAFYLAHNGLLRDFLEWVLLFNRKLSYVSASFPLAVVAAGLLGWYFLLKRRQSLDGHAALVLLLCWPLCTFSSILNSGNTMYFYLNLWFVLAAVLSGGLGVGGWLERFAARRAAVSGVAAIVLAALTLPSLYYAHQAAYGPSRYSHRDLARLIKLCRDDTCFVLLPHHPIFSRDATRLYAAWQYVYASEFSEVRRYLGGGDLAAAILDRRPALITRDISTLIGLGRGDEIFRDMTEKRIISEADREAITEMLSRDYAIEEIGNWRFYVRKDRAARR
jgi:hypothetical protein